MKYSKSKTTGKAGVLYVDNIVNSQGSVFRPVHQEDDFGIDGFIELVKSEMVSGQLIAVQIKTGDSYLSKDRQHFEVDVDERHLEYWRNFMVPVILVCYSPSTKVAAWVSIRDFIESEEYHGRIPIKKIDVPFYKEFNEQALSNGIAGLAHARADERLLIRCADMCLSLDANIRRQGFQILAYHPDSRGLKITCLLAKQFILDEDIEIAKDALFTLGYGVGRIRWSFNPTNKDEVEITQYAAELCSHLNQEEIRKLVELVDNEEEFGGPQSLAERCFDVLSCCFETAIPVLEKIVSDNTQPMRRRANALYYLYECNDESLEESFAILNKNPNKHSEYKDVIFWMFRENRTDIKAE
jgi:hypothetical protein